MAVKRAEIKIDLKSRILGTLFCYIAILLVKTLRVKFVQHPDYKMTDQSVYAFWHGRQLLPGVIMRSACIPSKVILVSPSHDGDLATVCLQKMGYDVVRGSSRDRNIQGLVSMIRKFKTGACIGFPIDGPIGPRHKAKPGAIFLTQKMRASLVPLGAAYEKAWVLSRTWDKMEIPKPFTRAVLYIGNR